MSDIPDIRLKTIGRALRRTGGNTKAAAEKLKIKRTELVALVNANPYLIEQAFEAKQRALDKTEATIRQALREGDMVKRMTAATHIVRRSVRWRNP